jgi:hypothetical protein
MGEVTFTTGKFQEFTAMREFALNFEDRKIKSVKLKISEVLLYDGEVADYKDSKGIQVVGRCPSLKSAINSMGWLVLNENGKKKTSKVEENKAPVTPPRFSGDFDGFRGGNFDSFAATEKNVHVGKVPSPIRQESFKKPTLIKEENLIVKTSTFGKKSKASTNEESDLSVAGDQVEVKKGFTVNSSTSVNKETKRSMPVVLGDEKGSETSKVIKNIKPPVVPNKKKSSFLVDANTPLTINDDMTSEEVNKMKTIPEEDSQNGKVVSRIDRSKMKVQEVDGIILKKKTTEGITLTTGVQAPKEISLAVKVSSGGESVTSIQDEGTVVAKVPTAQQKDADAAAKALARANARKVAAGQTQAMMEKEKKPTAKVVVKAPETDEMDYLSMLPADWGQLHWVKREVFIKSLTDINFIKYIMSVETIKALQNACNERLKELGQKSAG